MALISDLDTQTARLVSIAHDSESWFSDSVIHSNRAADMIQLIVSGSFFIIFSIIKD